MSTPLSAEQRLAISRAMCLQALRQPAWLLCVQRMSAQPTHASGEPPGPSMAAELLDRCLTACLDAIHRHTVHPQADNGPMPPPQT